MGNDRCTHDKRDEFAGKLKFQVHFEFRFFNQMYRTKKIMFKENLKHTFSSSQKD